MKRKILSETLTCDNWKMSGLAYLNPEIQKIYLLIW